MAGGPLEKHSGPALLHTAALFDYFLLALIVRAVTPFVLKDLPQLPPIVVWAGVCAVLIVVYWVLSEIVFGSRSLGRLLLGLSARDFNGNPLSKTQVVKRASTKLATLGLSGLRFTRPFKHDEIAKVRWHTKLAPPSLRSISEWRLSFETGAYKGKSVRLERIPGFSSHKTVKIGRDKNWANLPIYKDKNVSNRHCILSVRAGGLHLQDYGADQKGSSNQTKLHGRPIPPMTWVPLGGADHFDVADVRIRIQR